MVEGEEESVWRAGAGGRAKGERETIRRGGWQEETRRRGLGELLRGDAQLHGPRGRGTVRDDEKVLLFNGETLCEPV